ncbi:MAG: cytochrome c [Planctomycetaceae bacterium]
MKQTKALIGIAVATAFFLPGCNRTQPLEYVTSAKVKALKPDLQTQIAEVLREKCGTPADPRLLGNSKVSSAHLKRGAAVYAQQCAQCHGTTGDGNGAAAVHLNPRPRDYRLGIFKFTTTGYGNKPVREDLVKTVRRGIAGTSMPTFALLPKDDFEAVIDYVLALTHRGELEFAMAYEAEVEEAIEPDRVPEIIDEVLEKWRSAQVSIIQPTLPQPIFTSEHVASGKKAFLEKGCSKCHGEDGRGQSKENLGIDGWGFPTKAADLTSGMLHGGSQPIDVYRRIYAGINGTPMPGFGQTLAQEPETIWNLASYVLHVSNRRRSGDIPPAGLVAPLPSAIAPPPAGAAKATHSDGDGE